MSRGQLLYNGHYGGFKVSFAQRFHCNEHIATFAAPATFKAMTYVIVSMIRVIISFAGQFVCCVCMLVTCMYIMYS